MKNLGDKKVVIVHDWLVGGGAELVVEQLHKMLPDAPIYTSYCTNEWRKRLDNKVITGYLQKWPFSKLRKFLPVLRFRWFNKLDLSEFDLIISSSGNGEAKNVNKPEGATHICYCHSPSHFYWRHYNQYIKTPGFGVFNPLARIGLKVLLKPLRRKDLLAAKKPDYYIANSSHIESDIKKFYNRESTVIHPPVDINRFTNNSSKDRKGFVTVGRQTGYKHVDIIIKACNKMSLDLVVVGKGPEHKNLKKIAGPTIVFDADASDEKVADYMASARAFIFAAEEDFGITPVEAMASGTPVLAYKSGGSLDYVNRDTGVFFNQQSVSSLVDALQDFSEHSFSHKTIRIEATKFSPEKFRQALSKFINEKFSL